MVRALGAGPSAEQLVRRAAGRPGLVCLRGHFADGRPVLTSHPVETLPPGVRPSDVALSDVALPDVDADNGVNVVAGGWFGVLGYDGPSTRFAYHDHVVRLVDGAWRFEALWTPARATELERRHDEWAALVADADAATAGADGPEWTTGPFAGADRTRHLAAVEQAIELIRAGQLYQVNVCTRLDAAFSGSSTALFAAAADQLDPAYGAYLATGDGAVACLSPELFLRRRGAEVRSAPIKGTRPADPGNAAALRSSAKDVAENVMIVDLVRNDLGRVCEPGSVRASQLLSVVPRVGVLHLVSEVAGRLRAGVGDAELLDASFPPGSVTGAPKIRAVEAIGRLEPRARRAYTGAIGFVSPCWGAEFAVAIRTFEIHGGRIELGVGGGVTADSVPALEWRECLDKAAPLIAAANGRFSVPPLREPTARQLAGGLLETLLVIGGVPVRLADHLARLERSLVELTGAGVPPGLRRRVLAAAAAAPGSPGPPPDGTSPRSPTERAVVRVLVRPGAGVEIDVHPAPVRRTRCDAVTVQRSDGSWRHKWADRVWAAEAERDAAPAVPLFVAPDGVVLETSRGNVFLIDPDGAIVTPPLRDDLLPGVTRRALLDLARDRGVPTRLRPFDVDELRSRPAFWTSSVSGAVPIHRLDGRELPRADDLVAELSAALVGPAAIGLREVR